MRFWLIITNTIVFLLMMSSAGFAQGSPIVRSSGRTILNLQVEGARISSEELRALVPFSEGSKLRPELVREGTVNFYRTGLYERVEVLLKELPGGVNLKYSLYPKKWLEQIEFKGTLYLDDRELLSKIDLRSSEEITDEKLMQNVERLLQYYKFRGFVGSEITYHTESAADNRTKVIFRIREGNRLFVSDVRLAGDVGISRTKLLSIISSMPGTRLDGEDLDSDLKKVRDHLREKMYLTPTLNYSVEPASDFPDAVLVIFNINKGPYFKLQVLMNDKEEAEKRTKIMRSVFLESTTPGKAKLSLEKDVLDLYRKAGYPLTSVALEDRVDETGNRFITFGIDRGLKTIISDLQVDGVKFLPEERVNRALGLWALLSENLM
jgi:outer membrane protein assembly factor BamA